MEQPDNLLFTVNSPGEIAGWLRPLVYVAKERWPGTKITVVLLPCTFASGTEKEVASAIEGVNEVIPASHFFTFLFQRSKYQNPLLIHLGGDLMYAALLSWRWKMPSWTYLWGRWWWDKAFKGYFVKDQGGIEWLKRKKLPVSKGIIVGDLVFDSVKQAINDYKKSYPDYVQTTDPNLISFLPGSRMRELEGLAPFFLETAVALKKFNNNLNFQLALSPFLKKAAVKRALENAPHPNVGNLKGTLRGDQLYAPNGTSIKIISQETLPQLAKSALCVTIPGTKTAELACLGVPELMILPTNRPEMLPFIGPIGLLDWVPGGKKLKGRLLLNMREKIDYIALPNLLAKKAIIPELIEVLSPQFVAITVACMLSNPEKLNQQRENFHQLYGSSEGAAKRVFQAIEGA